MYLPIAISVLVLSYAIVPATAFQNTRTKEIFNVHDETCTAHDLDGWVDDTKDFAAKCLEVLKDIRDDTRGGKAKNPVMKEPMDSVNADVAEQKHIRRLAIAVNYLGIAADIAPEKINDKIHEIEKTGLTEEADFKIIQGTINRVQRVYDFVDGEGRKDPKPLFACHPRAFEWFNDPHKLDPERFEQGISMNDACM